MPGRARSRHRRHRRGPPDGDGLAFFDEGPEFVDLDLGEGQIAARRGTDRRAMPACQSEPMQDAIRGVVCEACHRPEAVALAQECQCFEDRGARAADGLEEGVLIGAGRAPACRAVIAPLHVAERLEVAGSDLAEVGAGRVVAPSLREFHGVSPPDRDDTLSGRSRLTDTLGGFHGLEAIR